MRVPQYLQRTAWPTGVSPTLDSLPQYGFGHCTSNVITHLPGALAQRLATQIGCGKTSPLPGGNNPRRLYFSLNSKPDTGQVLSQAPGSISFGHQGCALVTF